MNTMLNAESMELANVSIQKTIEASLAESERKGVADAWMMCSGIAWLGFGTFTEVLTTPSAGQNRAKIKLSNDFEHHITFFELWKF